MIKGIKQDELVFNKIAMNPNHFYPPGYQSPEDWPIPFILQEVNNLMSTSCMSLVGLGGNPINIEVPLIAGMNIPHQFKLNTKGCTLCQDTMLHRPNDPKCYSPSKQISLCTEISHIADPENMSRYSAVLIGVVKESWGHTPRTTEHNVLNISDRRIQTSYSNGTVGRAPAVLKKGELPISCNNSYFGHVRAMLEHLKFQSIKLIFLEFYPYWDTSDEDDMTNMVNGYLHELLEIKKTYQFTFVILLPCPKATATSDPAAYMTSLANTRKLSNIFMCYATKFCVAAIPTEGLMFTVPFSNSRSFYTYMGDKEPLINGIGTHSREYHRRAGLLFEAVICGYEKGTRDYREKINANYRPPNLEEDEDLELHTDTEDDMG